LDSIDAERKRIASDLHDTAGQGLMTISNRIDQVAKSQGQSKMIRTELIDVGVASKEVLDDIRRISHDLHPATLDFLGLEKSIKELFNALSKGGIFDVELQWGAAISVLDKDKHIQIFRVVQEVISNIAKHSDGDFVSAKFKSHDTNFEIEIADNGSETKVSAEVPIKRSLGKAIINQRINSMAGIWSFNRVEERSVFKATIPIIESGAK